MRLTELARLPLRYRPWRAQHLKLILHDAAACGSEPAGTHREHLVAAIDWLCHAQDVRDGHADAGGVSAGWNFEDGWLPSYPETSGYIVETFLAAAKVLGRSELVGRARRIVDWELGLQAPDGAFPGHFGEPGSRPVIFNTGQIMHGMVAGYTQLGRADCLDAAVRAGHWLARHQDGDGCWRSFEFNDIPHTYNTRATWALVATAQLAGDATLKAAAERHLAWALAQQKENGWFDNNAFTTGRPPFTHTIAYAIRGFLESGLLLDDARLVGAATRAADAMARVQRDDGWLAGTYADGWIPQARYSCLTGEAQMALNWLRLAQACGRHDLRDNARRALGHLKRHHRRTGRDPIVRGAIAGSSPIWGRYSMFEYPNWAPKFLADALMIDDADIAVPPSLTKPPIRLAETLHV